MADEFVRQYLQDNGDYPKNLTIDLWGSASMRTGGQEYSMALAFAGLTPIWDKNNARILGFSILSLAELGRPRMILLSDSQVCSETSFQSLIDYFLMQSINFMKEMRH